MNILLVTDAYPPEIRSASHLMQELAEELISRGHRVVVITSDPRYNLPENASRKIFKHHTFENGVEVIRVKTLPHHKVNFLVRGVAQITMPYLFDSALKRSAKKHFDVVLVYSPPLPLCAVGSIIKKKHGARFVLNVQDIFPQNAIDLGALRNPLLIKFFERMENRAYQQADIVTVHSDGNKAFLLNSKHVPNNKLQTLPNWIDIDGFQHTKLNRRFRKHFGLEHKFIFLFAGVLGPSQHLEFIIDIAANMQSLSDLAFLLVGDGTEKARLMALVKQRNLGNVVFHPFISKEEYSELVCEVDVGLVCLSPKNKTPVVPGKILGYMAARIPVLAYLNQKSDGHSIIQTARCGYSAVSDNIKRGTELLFKLYHERDTLNVLGENGYRYAVEHFSKKRCIDRLESFFQN